MDSQEDIVYPNDPKAKIKVDDDLKQLFREIELPRDMMDIEKELQKNGIKPMTNTAKRRAAAQLNGVQPKPKPKKKQREITRRTKLTNAHLPELFQNLNPWLRYDYLPATQDIPIRATSNYRNLLYTRNLCMRYVCVCARSGSLVWDALLCVT